MVLRGGDILGFSGDLVVLGQFSDRLPPGGALGRFDWRANAAVSRLRRARPDLFAFGHLTLVPTHGRFPCGAVLVAGLGEQGAFSQDLRREAYRLGLAAAGRLGAASVAVEALPVGGAAGRDAAEDLASAAAELGDGQPPSLVLYTGEQEPPPSAPPGGAATPSRAVRP